MSNTAAVNNGVVENTSISSTKTSTVGTTSLGKDAFLQLLVAQMQYQDPLEPSSDTEWIAQLAQFSSLEEMQNMSSTMGNTQALSMVGKTVSIESEGKTIEGVVDYVTMSGSTAYVSVNGSSYKASEVKAVMGDAYIQSMNGPQVASQTATFDYGNQSDVKFAVNLGTGDYAATGMYVAIDGKLVDGNQMSYDEKNKIVTISKDVMAQLDTGKAYDVTFIFDDRAETTVTGKAKIKVIGDQPKASEEKTEDTEAKVDDTETKA